MREFPRLSAAEQRRFEAVCDKVVNMPDGYKEDENLRAEAVELVFSMLEAIPARFLPVE